MDKEKHVLSMADKMLDWAEINSKCCDTQGAKSLSTYLFDRGYGNTKQAVKEFAERFKEYVSTRYYRQTRFKMLRAIDNFITELYGEP